jgi:hypothetical protein
VNYEFSEIDCNLYSEYCLNISPEIDGVTQEIGVYLASGLNCYFQKFEPDLYAVKDVISYDAIDVDLSRFPLLKVYRINEVFEGRQSTTSAVIAYCLAFPETDKLPGLLRWVSRVINELLENYRHQHENCSLQIVAEARKHEYRIMVNELAQPVYAFLRVNFSFLES